MASSGMNAPILEFDRARISYFIRADEANVIPSLSFRIAPGEALAAAARRATIPWLRSYALGAWRWGS